MKKTFCIVFIAALLFGTAAFRAAAAFPAPETTLLKTQESETEITYRFSVVSDVTAAYETQRADAYRTLLETMTPDEIAASAHASLGYPAGLLCEAGTADGDYAPVCFFSPFENEASVSLTADVLPALAASGLYKNEGFTFYLRFRGAAETATGYLPITEACDALPFECPNSFYIRYLLPAGTDNGQNPSFLLHDFSEDLLLENPTRTGYIFAGWETADGVYVDRVPAGTARITLRARFTPRVYRVGYVLTTLPGYAFIHVSNEVNPVRYTYGENTEIYDVSPPRGYVFRGWYETADFSGKPVTRIDAGRTGDVTLYAKWMTEKEALDEDVAAARWGDLDDDGAVTAADARLALRCSVGLEKLDDEICRRADFANLGRLNAACARILLRVAVGLDNMADILQTYGRL